LQQALAGIVLKREGIDISRGNPAADKKRKANMDQKQAEKIELERPGATRDWAGLSMIPRGHSDGTDT
jgi:hypothetical protein